MSVVTVPTTPHRVTLPLRCAALGNGHNPAAQERPGVEAEATGGERTQRSREGVPAAGQTDLEAMERLPPAQSGGDEDELLQAIGGEGDGQNVLASGGGAAHPCGAAQPLQPLGPSCDGGRRVSASGIWGMASQTWFMQQRPI